MKPSVPRYRVVNWPKYQHYKDRDPSWIKLYRTLLDDYEFSCLQDASKWLAIGSMLLAARLDNHIPMDDHWVASELHCSEAIDLSVLVSAGFLEVCDCSDCASASLAARYQVDSPEKRREEKRERRETTFITEAGPLVDAAVPTDPCPPAAGGVRTRPLQVNGSPGDFEAFWAAYPRKVGKAAAQRAWKTTAPRRPPLPAVLARIGELRASWGWTKDAGAFVPHPTTWLNRGGWDDEPGPSEPPLTAGPSRPAEHYGFEIPNMTGYAEEVERERRELAGE